MNQRCFCIFEGGGAKGIAHIGAYRALEREGLELCGFAGTSAGAIIAGLAAAGYSSRDLLSDDPAQKGSLLDELYFRPGDESSRVRTPTRLLGPVGWRGIAAARLLMAEWKATLAVIAFIVVLITEVVLLTGRGWMLLILVPWTLIIGAVALSLYTMAGLATLSSFSSVLNQAIARKIGRPPEMRVTFRDLEKAKRPPLKIVATNLAKRRLSLFSARTTPDCAVADAIAASVCLPIIFAPWKIKDEPFFDGGIVSNLPAWAFDDERALDRGAATVAVQIADAPSKHPVRRGIRSVAAAVHTVLSGADFLHKRGVDRLYVLRLEVDFDTLDFDINRARVDKVVAAAQDLAQTTAVARMLSFEKAMQDLCKSIADRSKDAISEMMQVAKGHPYNGNVRCAVFTPAAFDSEGRPMLLRNAFNSGYGIALMRG